jgi:adenylyl cyclase-associated protein
MPAGCEVESHLRNPGAELDCLLSRLESVTTRLEQSVGVASESLLRQCASQTTVPEPSLLPSLSSLSSSQLTVKMSVAAFGNIIQGPLSQYLQLSAKLGGDVSTHSKLVEKAFQ